MAQSDQNVVTENTGLQLHIPGMDQFKDLKFLQSETNPADLIVQLPDGTEIVFPNYIPLAQAGAPPAITLDDGTVIPGQEIVSLIDNLDYDLIAPAAGNDTVGPVTGGGAGFTADPSGPLGDDIGHGPYAGGVHIADNVEFTQVPGYLHTGSDTGGGGGGGENLPSEVAVTDNDGDTYRGPDYVSPWLPWFDIPINSEMDETTIDRSAYASDFTITLETFAPGGASPDWDGMRIVSLNAGDTITITHDPAAPGNYYIALDIDGDPTNGSNPVPTGIWTPMGWEYTSLTGSGPITYLMPEDGYVYIGTGFGGSGHPHPSASGAYYTQIEINDDHLLVGTNNPETIVSGSDADYLSGLGGNDVLIGNGGNDVLLGGSGDDQLSGGAGSDQFRFENVTDGHDIISDFVAGAGNDIVNLDALFDALSIVPASREVLVNDTGVDTILTIGDGSHTNTALAAAVDFSITLDGITGYTEAQLIANGNLVES